MKALSTQEHAQACGMFYDAVANSTLRHMGQPELLAAIKGAGRRQLGDAFAWSRRSSTVDITPLVAATLGVWAVANVPVGGLAF